MQYLKQKMRVRKNSCTFMYIKIFSSLFFTLSTPLKSIFGGLGVQPKSNLKVIRFMV